MRLIIIGEKVVPGDVMETSTSGSNSLVCSSPILLMSHWKYWIEYQSISLKTLETWLLELDQYPRKKGNIEVR